VGTAVLVDPHVVGREGHVAELCDDLHTPLRGDLAQLRICLRDHQRRAVRPEAEPGRLHPLLFGRHDDLVTLRVDPIHLPARDIGAPQLSVVPTSPFEVLEAVVADFCGLLGHHSALPRSPSWQAPLPTGIPLSESLVDIWRKSPEGATRSDGMTVSVRVAGVGMGRFSTPRKSAPYDQIAEEAIRTALADADLSLTDINQAYAGYVYGDSTSGQNSLYRVGMTGVPVVNVNNNCASGSSALWLARQAVASGAAECVLAFGFEQMQPGALGSHWA